MKTFILVLIAMMLTSCTTYSVTRTADSVDVRVSSTRSFEAPDLHYKRVGDDAEFDFSAQSVDNNTEAFLGMFQGMMGMMMQMMERMAVAQGPGPQ